MRRRADGKWAVTAVVDARKRYADGKGIETEAPLDEMFDIGVFTADPGAAGFTQANVLSMRSQRLSGGRHKIVMVVDREPKFVGIDPYVKYIDRNVQDNIRPIGSR